MGGNKTEAGFSGIFKHSLRTTVRAFQGKIFPEANGPADFRVKLTLEGVDYKGEGSTQALDNLSCNL